MINPTDQILAKLAFNGWRVRRRRWFHPFGNQPQQYVDDEILLEDWGAVLFNCGYQWGGPYFGVDEYTRHTMHKRKNLKILAVYDLHTDKLLWTIDDKDETI